MGGCTTTAYPLIEGIVSEMVKEVKKLRQNLLDPIGPELCLISRPNAYEAGFDVNHIIRDNKTNLKNFLDNCSGVVLETFRQIFAT